MNKIFCKECVKTISISLGLMMVLYFYMLCNFWWGNHDWGYLLSGASVESGLFEARYSQHLFTLWTLDGHILPVLSFLMGFICIGAIAVSVGKYLKIESKYWWVIALFIGANPHIFALFYYVYLFFPFMVWSLVGVLGLYFFEGKCRVYKFLGAVFLYVMVLGSYPPNLAFVFVLFVAKRLFLFEEEKENIKIIIYKFLYFFAVFGVAIFVYKMICAYLIKMQMVNLDMYNIKMRGALDMIKSIPYELKMSVWQFFEMFSFMKQGYVLGLSSIVALGMYVVIKKAKNKWFTGMLILGMLIASRFAFLVSLHPEYAVYRLMYWGRLGVYIVFLAVLMKQKDIWVKNVLGMLLVFIMSLFVVSNLEIQKVQNMGFISGRLYQKRLLDTVLYNDNFKFDGDYISLNFGQPNFRSRFYKDEYNTGEVVGLNLVFEFDVANYLFWEEKVSPVIIGAGISGRSVLRVDRGGKDKWHNPDYWTNNPSNMENIRFWLYTKAKPYPSFDSVYVDDKYLLLVLDKLTFNKHKELVGRLLDVR